MSDIVERLLDYPKFLTAIPPDTLMREAASTITTLQERVKVLEAALSRLGSMEAFTLPRMVTAQDDELIARIDFARTALGEKQ